MATPILWAKQTTEGRQVTNDGSRLVNFFFVPVDDPDPAKSGGILYSTPGLSSRIPITGVAAIHGMIPVDSPTFGKRLFGLAGDQFFEVRGSSMASYAVRSFTNSPDEAYTGPARLASDGRRIVFIRGRSLVMWDQDADTQAGAFVDVYAPVSTNPQELLADEDWIDVIWINGYFVLLSKTGEIFHSQLHSGDFDQLDFATAERNPDPGVGLAKFQGRFYVFGTKSLEIYRETGEFPFAFRRVGDSETPIGCLARDTIQVNEGGVFWLGSDRMLYVTAGGTPTKLSTATVEYDIAHSNTGLARGYVYTEEGRRFYSLILTLNDNSTKNWTIDLVTRLWHERTNTRILCAADYDTRTVVGLDNSNDIMEQSLDVGTEAGEDVGRLAISSLLHNNLKVLTFPSVFLDTPILNGQPKPRTGHLRLDWFDDGNVPQDYDEDGTLVRGDDGNLERPKQRFNGLGKTTFGRNFRVRVNSSHRIQIEASYIDFEGYEGYGVSS